MRLCILLLTLTAVCAVGSEAPLSPKQKQFIEDLLKVLPKDDVWEAWVTHTSASLPDFDKLPSIPYLPDPLRFQDGKEVKKDDWPRRRQELLELFKYYIIGKFPPSPGNVRASKIESHQESGANIDEVLLEFGPQHKAKLHMELIIPRGEGPFPVFMTQDNHRAWALVAVSRGYIGCVYAGADSRDDTGEWPIIWPEYDWTKLTRRAWAASRCIDYLHTLPVVDTNRIALTGHSRNGKLSIIGAAIDRRVNAVISSSSGAGGAPSFRLFSETEFGEGIELITRDFPDWLHPRLRLFAGRENQLPIDMPELIACIAPRPCLISTALNDANESAWAIEQSYYSAHRVYELLGRPHDLNIRYRPGGHETKPEDIERYLDWLDVVFGRGDFSFDDVAIFPTYDRWLKISEEKFDAKTFPTNSMEGLLTSTSGKEIKLTDDWLKKREDIRNHILWSLGEAPPFAESGFGTYGAERPYNASMLGRPSPPAGITKRQMNFGNYIAGDLYLPANADQLGRKIPAVIWLHPISNPYGYVPGYRRGEPPHLTMAKLGFAVLAFDQIGHGARLQEVANFYPRYPTWSLLGKMVEDTLAAFEALLKLDFVDPQKIFLVGYSTGAMTALHAAALDDRIAGVVSVAGFTSMRLNTLDKGAGGIARYSRWLPLQPRLGAFLTEESRIPYDYHEVLAMIAPRPVLVFAPKIDYRASLPDIRRCVEEAQKVFDFYGVKENVKLFELDDYNRFSPESQKVVYAKLTEMIQARENTKAK